MNSITVRTEKLSKRFGNVSAVDNLDLDVDSGQFLTILGPSGCGKTTLLRMIAGFEKPTSGRIYISDRDVTNVPPHQRPSNMVFQRFALFPHLTVSENVGFGLSVKKVPEAEICAQVDRMLKLVQLPGYGNRRINQLSGGQAQRVALARALVNKPEVLLLDEPLGSLDLKIRQQMQVELKLLHAQLGMTFIYVTHDQEEAMGISDRIVVMCEGSIAQSGCSEEIYNNPTCTFVAGFLGHSNILAAKVSALKPTQLKFLGKEFRVRQCDGLRLGQDVNVLIRPEALMVSREKPDEEENDLFGEIVDTTFKGAFVHYLILVEGIQLKVLHPIHEVTTSLGRGETVNLTFGSDDALVLTS
ncbi:MAG: ABC transporter ATP-binding protein [Anaerolineales bacterium]|nr:ABC transporter ATP-binding protein [Anaerolineales bacterium]